MKIRQFFQNLFSSKKDPQVIPCDHIACNDCVYFDRSKMACGISDADIKGLQDRFNVDDIKRFKRER